MLAQSTLPTQPANIPQGAVFWVGCVFAFILLIVLIIVLLKPKDLPPARHNVLRLLSALLAALCGILITGSALFTFTHSSPTSSFVFSGAAGFALFGCVYFMFGKPPAGPVVNPDISFKVGQGWKFKHAVNELLKLDKTGGFAVFLNMTDDELNAPLEERQVLVSSFEAGIQQLYYLASGKIRRYDVEHIQHEYRIIGR